MKKLIFTLMAASFIFVSCDSEQAVNQNDAQAKQMSMTSANVNSALENLRNMALADINQRRTVFYDNEKGANFRTESGTSIVIPPGSIVGGNGAPINGNIQIEYIEIFNRAKMVVTNKPTMGFLQDGEKGLLVTGGEFYLNITFQEQQVKIVSPIKVNIKTNNSEAEPANMVLWNGVTDDNGDLTWDSATPDNLEFENDGEVFQGDLEHFDVLIKNSSNFGWCNIDKLVEWPGTKVQIKVTVPAAFNQSNSAMYFAVKGEKNMLAQFDTFDPGSNTFGEHAGLVPVGLDCHIIFVGEQGGNYVYYILSTAISSTGAYTVPASGLISTTSYTDVESAISALP